jgi:hypothetical protein
MSCAQVGGLKRGLAEDEIQERCVVRLHEEEEDFFKRYVKQRGADDYMAGVTPDAGADQVRVPRDRGEDGDLVLLSKEFLLYCRATTYGNQKNDLESIESGEKRAIQQRKQYGRRDRVLDMAGGVLISGRSRGKGQWHSQSPWCRRRGRGARLLCPGKRVLGLLRVNPRAPVQIRRLGHGRVVPGTNLAKNEPAMAGVLQRRWDAVPGAKLTSVAWGLAR